MKACALRVCAAARELSATALLVAAVVGSAGDAASGAAPPDAGSDSAPSNPPFATRCEDLASVTLLPESIALPTGGAQIDNVQVMSAPEADNHGMEFCRINGRIKPVNAGSPDIRFDLNLPGRWNGRALQIGGGGYSGAVVSGTGVTAFSPGRAPLAQGYATFGDDSGHVGNSARAMFGLLDEAVMNFGYAHLKKTHDAALALIVRVYGYPPLRTYFAGGSTGGREGYTVMQRFPGDYDGVIANSPALNFSGMRLMGVKIGQAEYASRGGFVPPALLERVYKRALEACDALDGAADGIVSDIAGCRKREPEIIKSLRCRSHAWSDGESCLTDAQLATLLVMRDGLTLPYRLAHHANRYPGYNAFEGTRFTSGLGLAHEGEPRSPPTFRANGYLFTQGDGYIRYFVVHDASVDSLRFDVLHPGRFRQQVVLLSATIGAMDTDLSRYIARGGKLITLQGLADEVSSPNQMTAYYRAILRRFGSSRVNSFMRLYMVPGFQHGNGAFVPSIDLLGVLDDWVTRGIAPETLTAMDIAPATRGRSRPLCRYPRYPRYVGSGDVNQADSFRCTGPSESP
jgi:feruloyl esterase